MFVLMFYVRAYVLCSCLCFMFVVMFYVLTRCPVHRPQLFLFYVLLFFSFFLVVFVSSS